MVAFQILLKKFFWWGTTLSWWGMCPTLPHLGYATAVGIITLRYSFLVCLEIIYLVIYLFIDEIIVLYIWLCNF